MKQQTIQEWFRRVDAPGTQEEDYCIYVIRDPAQMDLFSADGTVFYVGQSANTHHRLMVPMGLLWPGPSHVGDFIHEHAPASGSWLFEQYTLEDCSQLVGICRNVDEAEETLIKLYRPCLNTACNLDPTPLPAFYKSRDRDESSYGKRIAVRFGIRRKR